ncbi:MAG TPA: hypothetical protein VFF95_03875 [Candidatus Binatus sp.]|jgi:hypothetical protein|nr:hypothetical protein [Candidatus Binatus sp.]
MSAHPSRLFFLALAASFVFLPAGAQSQKKTKHPKAPDPKVENYYGGLFLIGDGGIPAGACFRINGRITSADFFNGLKSYESDDGTIFRLGANEVTQFPDKLLLSLTIQDQPCSTGLQPVGTGVYLTQETMSSLKLSLYWKHGVDLRPVGKIALVHFSVDPIQPYATSLAAELPKRYLWSYELGIPAADVPLTDSLVLIFRTMDGHIAARVAARL